MCNMRLAAVVVLLSLSAHSYAGSIQQASTETSKPLEPANEENNSTAAGEPSVSANEVPERDTAKIETNQNVTAEVTFDEATAEEKPSEEKEEEKPLEDKDKVSYYGNQLVRAAPKNKEQRKYIRELEANGEIETWLSNGTAVDLVVRRKEILEFLQNRQINYEVVIENLQDAINDENPQLSEDEWNELVGRKVKSYSLFRGPFGGGQYSKIRSKNEYDLFPELWMKQVYRPMTRIKPPGKKGHRLTWQMYHRMDDIHGYLDYLAATYPQTVTVSTIGSSVEGRPLKLVKISSGETNKPAIWVDAGIHAREWITPASITYVISQMVEGGDGTKGVDWYILPLVNPDGYEYSHTRDRLWRKNRKSPEKGSCAGIDLNRNFGYRWGGQGASRQPCRETFAGAGAFSEPETSAINKFVTSRGGQIKAYVSLHSYGQYILYPWGYDRKVPPDYEDLSRVGKLMATAIRAAGGPDYTVGSAANTLYPASGGSDDWAKGSAKIKYAYTIELRDSGRHGFVLPAQYISPTAKDAYAALSALATEIAKQ